MGEIKTEIQKLNDTALGALQSQTTRSQQQHGAGLGNNRHSIFPSNQGHNQSPQETSTTRTNGQDNDQTPQERSPQTQPAPGK